MEKHLNFMILIEDHKYKEKIYILCQDTKQVLIGTEVRDCKKVVYF
jgi:hypothetical protein